VALFAALCLGIVITRNFGLNLLDFFNINCLKVALVQFVLQLETLLHDGDMKEGSLGLLQLHQSLDAQRNLLVQLIEFIFAVAHGLFEQTG